IRASRSRLTNMVRFSREEALRSPKTSSDNAIGDMIKAISWNIAHRPSLWHDVMALDADVALLQEAPAPPQDIAARMVTDGEPWRTEGGGSKCDWRAAVVRLSEKVKATWHEVKPIHEAKGGEFAVSRLGTLSAATIAPPEA